MPRKWIYTSNAKQFVCYIRITDKAGNVAYLSSDGAEYDTTAPEITGADDGATYYTTQIITVTVKTAPIAALTDGMAGKNADNVTSGDNAALQAIIDTLGKKRKKEKA